MKKILYYVGLACMAIFLFVIHTKYLNVLENWKDSDLFDFGWIDLRQILHYIISATFAVMVTRDSSVTVSTFIGVLINGFGNLYSLWPVQNFLQYSFSLIPGSQIIGSGSYHQSIMVHTYL